MEDMVHERYGTWEIWYMGEIIHRRYGTSVIRHMEDKVHERYVRGGYGACEIW